MRKSDVVTVTYNYLARRSSFRESSLVLTQANYRRIQRKVKRKWNKRIFFNLKSTYSHSFSTFTSCLTCWLAVNNMRPQQKLLFLFCFRIKKKKHQKPMTLLINKVLFSFEMKKYASFAQLMSFDSWNTYLRNFVALIYCTFLPYKQILPVKPFFLSLTF